MWIQKMAFYITVPISLACLLGSLALEFLCADFPHAGYASNILIGVFASGLLIAVTSLVSYFGEKAKYYKAAFREVKEALFITDFLICALKNKNKDFLFREAVQELDAKRSNIQMEMWNFSKLIRRNRKDRIIDESVDCLARIAKNVQYLLEQSELYKSGRISQDDYFYAYREMADKLSKTYRPNVIICKNNVDTVIKSLVKDRTLYSLFSKGE